MSNPMRPRRANATIVLHPKLQEEAGRLLKVPELTCDTIRRIKRDLHMERPVTEQLSLDIKSNE